MSGVGPPPFQVDGTTLVITNGAAGIKAGGVAFSALAANAIPTMDAAGSTTQGNGSDGVVHPYSVGQAPGVSDQITKWIASRAYTIGGFRVQKKTANATAATVVTVNKNGATAGIAVTFANGSADGATQIDATTAAVVNGDVIEIRVNNSDSVSHKVAWSLKVADA